jgi:hypothetical protein
MRGSTVRQSVGPSVRRRSGVVLLEALVALAILSAAGIALLALVTASLGAERGAREREQTLASADRVLAAMTLLKRDELDQRIGRRRIGEFMVEVQRPERTLYRIAVAEERAAEVEMLLTVVYRPVPQVP